LRVTLATEALRLSMGLGAATAIGAMVWVWVWVWIWVWIWIRADGFVKCCCDYSRSRLDLIYLGSSK
jgi:hypothetical protein